MADNRKIIYLAGFLFSIPIALTSYINSSLLGNYVNKNYVGLIYAVASIIAIWSLIKMPKILNRYGNRRTALIFCLLITLAFIFLAFGGKSFIVIPAFILYFVSGIVFFASLDIFVEDFSRKSAIGTFRGLYLMILNFAWIIAQIISGSIVNKSAFFGIYLLSAGFAILVSLIFVIFLRNFKDPKYDRGPIRQVIKSFIRDKNLLRIYLINFILKFFYAWMIIYTPIYLYEYMHFGWDKIGIIFSIMLTPFVLLDFPLGKLSDKIGEKEMLLAGFLIAAVSTFAIPLISQPILWIWAAVLFFTRVGAAAIEVMSESYFFKAVDKSDADKIDFFRNTSPFSYIFAPLLAVIFLLFIPSFEYLFFILCAILLAGFFATLRLKDVT